MNPFELTADIADPAAYRVAVAHLRARGIALPSFSELAEPRLMPAGRSEAAALADKAAPDPRNLFGVHWYNSAMSVAGREVPAHIELPSSVPYHAACRLMRGAVILVALCICWRRMRLGALWPSDVLGGILWGMVVLSLLTALFLPSILLLRVKRGPLPSAR